MANLSEIDEFTGGIYQLEITDQVEGGALGIANFQAKSLANRTRYLYNRVTALLGFAPKNRGWFIFDPKGSSGTLTYGGDVTFATSTILGAGSRVTVSVANAVSGTYKVNISLESLSGSIETDWGINAPVWKGISPTQFYVGVSETSAAASSIKVHVEVVSI